MSWWLRRAQCNLPGPSGVQGAVQGPADSRQATDSPPPPSSSSPPVELTVCHFQHMERNHGTFVKVESRLCGGDEEHEGGGQEREGQRCKIREGIVRDINLMQAWAEEGERWRDIMSHKLNLLNQTGKHKVQSNKADRQVRICNQPSTLQVG